MSLCAYSMKISENLLTPLFWKFLTLLFLYVNILMVYWIFENFKHGFSYSLYAYSMEISENFINFKHHFLYIIIFYEVFLDMPVNLENVLLQSQTLINRYFKFWFTRRFNLTWTYSLRVSSLYRTKSTMAVEPS